MRHLHTVLFGLTSATLLAGCSVPSTAVATEAAADSVAIQPKFAARAAAAPMALAENAAEAGTAYGYNGTARKFRGEAGRQMAFTASLTLNVDDTGAALAQSQEITRKSGGYTQDVSNDRAVLRIPVAKAEETVEQIEKLGTVLSRRITGEDLTEQVTDLGIRLDNLQKLRTRLSELLKRSAKVEELLKVEQELSRVTTEIEQLQARLKQAEKRISYVTLTVMFQTVGPRPVQAGPVIPLTWVKLLGNSAGKSSIPVNGESTLPFALELPEDFVTVYAGDNGEAREAVAVSANDCVIRLTRRDNLSGGSLAFWEQLIRRALTETNNYVITENQEIRTAEGLDARRIAARRSVGKEDFHYQLLVVPFNNRFWGDGELFLIEAWGPGKAFEELMPKLKEMESTLDLSFWR